MPKATTKKNEKQQSLPTMETKPKSVLSDINKTLTDELCLTLCGPIGSPLHRSAEVLAKLLERDFKYEVVTFRLSDFIRKRSQIPTNPLEAANALIGEGNALRAKYGNSILAELAIQDMTKKRETEKGNTSPSFKTQRRAYVIDSVKNADEIRMLRSVYQGSMYLIGVDTPLKQREASLKNDKQIEGKDIDALIDRDSGEEIQSGQSVRSIFPQADFFLASVELTENEMESQIGRFLRLIFRTKVETPTLHESAMYAAFSAGLNSACLSRQVGASIANLTTASIVSVGWNDVPKAGGGLYNSAGEDKRCFNYSKPSPRCHNDHEKHQMAAAIADLLHRRNLISAEALSEAVETLKESKIRDLLEFSRAVHAEMFALLCAHTDLKTAPHAMFTTTYPCHNCARHIVAAGIQEVFYIEPYRKSLATTMHDDALTEDSADVKKVRLIQFSGVAPSRYTDFFHSAGVARKDSKGAAVSVRPTESAHVSRVTLESIPVLEGIVVKSLVDRGVT